jgi:L-rhamnose mutarotase
MAKTITSRYAFWALMGFVIVSCNIFNPSGSGDGGGSTDAFLTEGENAFRDQDFAASMEAFESAIKADSTSALAYYGYAKATLRFYQLNASTILSEVDEAKANASIPFLDASDEKLTRYLQATSKVRRALSAMTNRDTLTRWWRYQEDTTSKAARKDAKMKQRIAFIRQFMVKGEQGDVGYYPAHRFPLSDGAIAYEKIVVDYGFIELLYALVHLRDLDQNDTIDSRDNLLTKLSFKSEGGFKLDSLQNIATELQNDTVARQNFNNLIQNVQSGLGSASQVISLLAPNVGGTGDSLSNTNLTDNVSQNVDSVITSLGSAVGFYQFGDSKDNDGDGCVDEEILDGKDNDGDGFLDEDARVVGNNFPDNVDNDHNGKKDLVDTDENLGTDHMLLFVSQSSFVKGSLYRDRDFKIRVQGDSLTLRTNLTISQKNLLDSAKSEIGGCWNQY